MILLWTEAQLGTLTQRFPLIMDNKRLLRADGARDLSDYHYVDFKRTAGILSFPVGLAGLAVVCEHVYVCVRMDAAQNLQALSGYFEQLLFTTLGSDII